MDSFDCRNFKRVELEDAKILIPYLTHSRESSCEFNFSNLYTWGHTYETNYAFHNNRLYIHLVCEDMLLFATLTDEADPEITELLDVSDAMRKCGFTGTFEHIRPDYLNNNADILEHFSASPMDDRFDEYIYSVDSLFELRGSKLAKKRNLIRQFERDYPDYEVRTLSSSNIAEAVALADKWRAGHPAHDSIEMCHESEAIHHLSDSFDELDNEGIAIYVDNTMAAFATCSRINSEMFTEPFEKALHEYKGAAQMVNHELMKTLVGRVKYINREQDLGDEGLRQAKLSYEPISKLKNFTLTRKI